MLLVDWVICARGIQLVQTLGHCSHGSTQIVHTDLSGTGSLILVSSACIKLPKIPPNGRHFQNYRFMF